MSQFNPGQSTLDLLASYDTFMESINRLIDMGCGTGADLEWWATRVLEDDDGNQIPLNIKCTGVDLNKELPIAQNYKNIVYERRDFELITPDSDKKRYDVIWSNNAFQYALTPIETLRKWRNMLTEGGMLALIVPSTTEITYNRIDFIQHDYVYYNYTTVSLLHMLALTGFECAFMEKLPGDPWIKAVVYKTDIEPFDPRTTQWYQLAETNLLPESAIQSINRFGYLRQQDLVLEWLDHSLRWYGED